MKVLTAARSFGYPKIVVEIASLMRGNVPVTEQHHTWARWDVNDMMDADIDRRGLQCPVLVKMRPDGKWHLVASGTRISYAIRRGYTHVEAIEVKDKFEGFALRVQMGMLEREVTDKTHPFWEMQEFAPYLDKPASVTFPEGVEDAMRAAARKLAERMATENA